MIAADSSSLIAHLSGATGDDVANPDQTLADHLLALPPVLLTELLSDPRLPEAVAEFLQAFRFWKSRTGIGDEQERYYPGSSIKGRRARLAYTLIAQSCLDHDMPIIVRDRDFRSFAVFAGLKLLPA